MALTTSQFRHLGLTVAPVCYLGRAIGIFYYMGLATGFYHLGLAVGRRPFLLPGPCSLLSPFSTTWPLLPHFLQTGPVTGFFYYMSLANSSFFFTHELWHQPYPRKSFIFTG